MAKKYKYRHREIYNGVAIDIRANSTKELVQKIKKKKDQIDRQTVSPDTTLLRFGQMFLETYKVNSVSASWYADLESMLKTKIVPGIGNRPVGRLKPIDVQQFLNSLTDLADSYVKKIFDLTKQIFHQAYKNGLTVTDFSEDLIRPTGKASDSGRSLTAREIAALLKVISGTQDELFLRIMLQCGLRPGEVCALIWKDINLQKRTVSVTKAQKKDGTIGSPKSSAGVRLVPIPSDLLQLMRALYTQPLALVCPKQKGGRHTKSSLRKLWDRTKHKMNLELGAMTDGAGHIIGIHPVQEPLRLYDLRHTYCTNLEKAGVPINIASRLMGHSDISITSKIYTHESDEALMIARDLIDASKGHGQSDGKEPVQTLKIAR